MMSKKQGQLLSIKKKWTKEKTETIGPKPHKAFGK